MITTPAFTPEQRAVLESMRFTPACLGRFYRRNTLGAIPDRSGGIYITDIDTGKSKVIYTQDQLYLFIILNAIDCLDYA